MKELLGEALADRGSGTAQKCEQALALATLAAFLSYLTFGPRPPTSSLSSCQNSHLSDLLLHLISQNLFRCSRTVLQNIGYTPCLMPILEVYRMATTPQDNCRSQQEAGQARMHETRFSQE